MVDTHRIEEYAEIRLVGLIEEAVQSERNSPLAAYEPGHGVGAFHQARIASRIQYARDAASAHSVAIREAYKALHVTPDPEVLKKWDSRARESLACARRAIAREVEEAGETSGLGHGWKEAMQMHVRMELSSHEARIARESKLDLIALDERRPASHEKLDLFICHSSADKTLVARPLMQECARKGLKVWMDEGEITLGDPLRQKIDSGLARSRFGVVILSPSFFEPDRDWAHRELDGLFAKEADGNKVILPILHEISRAELAAYSPLIAGKVHCHWSEGVEAVVNKILAAVRIGRATE